MAIVPSKHSTSYSSGDERRSEDTTSKRGGEGGVSNHVATCANGRFALNVISGLFINKQS